MIEQRPLPHLAALATTALLALTAGAMTLLWSWNTAVAEPFGLPLIAFRHGVAIELGVLAIGLIFGAAFRVGRGRTI